jgi:hypothetical protein
MAPLHKLQRSAITDYISNLLRAIDAVKGDSAQLRNLVYELARMRVGQADPGRLREEIANREQLQLLEMAIYRVEVLSRLDDEQTDAMPAALEERVTSNTSSSELRPDVRTFASTKEREQQYDGANNLADQLNNEPLAIYDDRPSSFHDQSLSSYLSPIRERWFAQTQRPIQIWNVNSTSGEGAFAPSRIGNTFWIALSLATAASIALMAFSITYILLSNYGNGFLRREDATQNVLAPAKTPTSMTPPVDRVAKSNVSADQRFLGFPLPTSYGIYAVSEEKLIELKPLPISVPDPRIAISATIGTPSDTVVPSGNVQFVIFRRDTVFAAPDRILIRVVARVARELRFTNNKPTIITKSEGEWAIRSNSYEFRVGPIPDHSEMLVVRPEGETSLPAGRYALVLKGIGYDFTVAGQITDPAQCIERSASANGTIYSECRKGTY